jgi:predicted nuclease of predicted toxin-antitoxin system
MRFLVDMNLSPAWVPFLRDAGLEAVHWSEVGAANVSDRELMDWADAHDHIVLTNDLDFSAILAATRRQRTQCRPSPFRPAHDSSDRRGRDPRN